MAAEDSPRVSFDIKELLGRMDDKLEKIDGKLDHKVDLTEFNLMSKQVDANGKRIDEVERKLAKRAAVEEARRDDRTQTFSKREKIIALVLAGLAVLVQIALLSVYLRAYPGGHG